MRVIWLLLLLPFASQAGETTRHWDHELLLAGAGGSLEVTLISHTPLPLAAAQVRDWLELPTAAGCQLLRAPRDVPTNEADRPKSRYVWQFQCAQLTALSEVDFHAETSDSKLYLQWALPVGQGKALLDEPVTAFDFSAANQVGGIL